MFSDLGTGKLRSITGVWFDQISKMLDRNLSCPASDYGLIEISIQVASSQTPYVKVIQSAQVDLIW